MLAKYESDQDTFVEKEVGYGIVTDPKEFAKLFTRPLQDILDEYDEEESLMKWLKWVTQKEKPENENDDWLRIKDLIIESTQDAMQEEELTLARLITTVEEANQPSVFLIKPVGAQARLSRGEEVIDDLEWLLNEKDYVRKVQYLDKVLTGFPGLPNIETVQYRTKKKPILPEFLIRRHLLGPKGYIKDLYEQHGFSSYKNLQLQLLKTIPTRVRWIAEYMNLFKNPATIQRLRPLMVTYCNQ